jgi:cysteine desulfurase
MSETMIYLDHAATTAVRPGVLEAMEPYLRDRYGNASSAHAAGRAARAALEESRERVAAVLGAQRSEILFTGSGTESDNLAVLGRWRAAGGGVAVSAAEHSAVLEAASQAAREGAELTVVAVDGSGLLDLDALGEALESPVTVVSVLWGNNEVGTIQPVAAIAELCRSRGAAYHTDAVQAVGHIPVSVADAGCDLLSLSGHKFGGPQGVGALFVRRGTELAPLIRGGGQEAGLRAGTSNVAGAVGLAEALERAASALSEEASRLTSLRDRLQDALVAAVPGLTVHGPPASEARLPHVLSVGVDGVDPDVLLPALDLAGVAVSSGSACHTGASSPSHVLLAMGVQRDTVLRLSLGWTTTRQEVDEACATVARVIGELRVAQVAT